MSAGVKGIVTQARRAAQKRGQAPSTAHLLLVMLQKGSDAGRVLGSQGLQEAALLGALRDLDEESGSTFERTLERSEQIATQLGSAGVSSLHLLLAITRDARSAGHRSLSRLGMGPMTVHDRVLEHLGASAKPRRPRRPEPREDLRLGLRAPRRMPGRIVPKRPAPTQPKAEPRRTADPRRAGRPSARRDPSRAPKHLPPAELAALDAAAAAPATATEGLLDPEAFPTLHSIGRNLSAMAREGKLDPVIGREREVEQLLDILARRRSNNPILVGAPGVGKTAVVEGLAQALIQDESLGERVLIEVSAGSLVRGTGVRGALSEKIRALKEEVQRSEGKVVLFIDEIHSIVGGGEGPDDLVGELKTALARGELPCIGATTEGEFRKHIEKDPALVRRFSQVHIGEPTPADAIKILQGIAPRYEEHHKVRYEAEALSEAVSLSVRYLAEQQLPDKAIGVIDLAAARVRRRGKDTVDRAAVASVIAEQAQVPAERLLMKDGERLLRLEELLREKVVGHGSELSTIADVLRKGAAGFLGERPLGTFLFLGPTGVGKTECAKAISDVFFPGTAMTRIDMSELSDAHSVARLMGAPPGYVGHDSGGQLTEAVRRRPYQLVLLDEIEKAHPEVLLSLLPLLDEGRLTDGKGRTTDFRNTIIVLTSNLGAVAATKRKVGFGNDAVSAKQAGRSQALEAARRAMPPELWNRIDEPLYFSPLSESEVELIAGRMLRGVAKRLSSQGVRLKIEASVAGALAAAGGFDPALGARPMRRVISRLVEAPLAAAMLGGEFGRGDTVVLAGDGAKVLWRRQESDPDRSLALREAPGRGM